MTTNAPVENPACTSSSSCVWAPTLGALLVVAGLIAYIQIATYEPNTDRSMDALYHLAMGDRFFSLALKREFPATQLSIWRDHFSNKELGFHFLLMLIRKTGDGVGLSAKEPPFLYESAALLAIWIGIFVWGMLRLGARQAYVFIFLILFISPLFTFRLLMVRPHNLAVALVMLTAVLICLARNDRERLLAIFGMGVVFAWSYSNPHFCLHASGSYAIARFWQEKHRAALYPLASVAGVAAGLTIHPQVPHTYLIWKVQCWDVIINRLTGNPAKLSEPAEFAAPSLKKLAENGFPSYAVLLVVVFFIWRYRRRLPLPRDTQLFMIMSIAGSLGFIITERCIEYAIPFTGVTAALVYRDYLADRPRRFHLINATICACLAAVVTVTVHAKRLGAQELIRPAWGVAEWLETNLPKGSYIANMSWGDFPLLFYATADYRFSMALDPFFPYAENPKRMQRIAAITNNGAEVPSGPELAELLESRFVYLSPICVATARRFAETGYRLAYQGVDGWVFDLLAPPMDHQR